MTAQTKADKMKFIVIAVSAVMFLSLDCFSQTDEEILKDLKDSEDKSSLKVGFGIGNKIFSTHNNTLNAQQSGNSLIFTPSIGYFHKSGLSISATGYILSSTVNNGLLQYAINPAYDYYDDHISVSLSFTHYITTNEYNTSLTPIQNDLYGSIKTKKGWVRPGVEMGYASGSFKEIVHVDTTLKNNGVLTNYNFIDTSTIKQSSFSFSPTLEHSFLTQNVFTEKDLFSFTPKVMVNFGSGNQKVIRTTSGNFSTLVNHRRGVKRKFRQTNQGNYKEKFELQSLGLNFEGDYSIGKFEMEPNIYFDYYLPKTQGKRLSTIISINFTYSF